MNAQLALCSVCSNVANSSNSTYQINMPMLHSMGNIGGLNQVLDNNRSLAIGVFERRAAVVVINGKGGFPSLSSQGAQLLVHNVRRHDSIDHQPVAETIVRVKLGE